VDVESSSIGTLSMVCLHPVTAFSTGFILLGDYEDKGFDIANDDLGYPNGVTFNNVSGFLIFDIFLWSFFTWYFNRTVKGEYGRANPLYFMFLPSYWFPKKFKNSPVVTDEISNEEINDAHFEPVTDQLKAQEKDGKCVSLKKLVKTFKNTDGSEKIAVNQLSLNFYAGQITALLGHNGAGKTTTIHMLTGLLNPTSGDASVMGQSVSTQMPLIRENIGICLQHDCLFDLLTVQEHIEFYSMLKNSYNKDDVKTTMKDVALYEKRYTPSKNLSGGMKRKLSVAIAFCGGSKTVFLDEPTSGMDPFSRRFTWNVIRQYRSDRCIVLTTHFMDEADILGDRIAIMSSGSLRCIGSSLYLKKEYGVGYQITLEKNSSKDNEIISQKAISAVHSHIEEAVVLSNVGSELSFQIPLQCSPKFPAMLRELESMQEDVVNYGVSITTLEEVFLIIAKGENTDKMTTRASSAMAINTEGLVDKSSIVTEDVDVVDLKTDDEAEVAVQADKASTSADSKKRALGEITFQPTYSKHMKALVKKRALNFKRDKKAWICSVILPALISFLGFIALKFAPDLRNLDALTLVIDDYNEDIDTDSNPLVFNAPDTTFECNPGNCVNMRTWNDTIDTDDAYSVCGIRVDESCRVTSMPTESKVADPAVPFDENVDKIFLSSQFLNQTRADFKASRYGALIFTRDIDSVDVESETLFEPESICRNNSDMFYLRNEDLHCVSQKWHRICRCV
jgi:ABC-type multidrug transport system ATPase subunit